MLASLGLYGPLGQKHGWEEVPHRKLHTSIFAQVSFLVPLLEQKQNTPASEGIWSHPKSLVSCFLFYLPCLSSLCSVLLLPPLCRAECVYRCTLSRSELEAVQRTACPTSVSRRSGAVTRPPSSSPPSPQQTTFNGNCWTNPGTEGFDTL